MKGMSTKGIGTGMIVRGVVIVVLSVTFVACGGPEERKAKYRARAQEYMNTGNYPKARVALRNVLKIDPKDAQAYYLFAQVEEKEKNWRNAVQLYQEVTQLVPDHTGALITLAKYYLEARLTEHVIATADKVLKKDPLHPQASALMIAAQATTEESVGAAIPKAEALATRFPTEPDVAILLATLYSQQRRFQEAGAVLQRAVDVHPTDIDLLNNLSETLVRANDMAGAERVVRRMIDAEPNSFDHRLRLARLYDGQGVREKAEAVLREAVGLQPDNEQRRLMLADFLVLRKDIPAAERALLDAAEYLPHSTAIQFGLAALYQKSGQETKARDRYTALAKEYKGKAPSFEAKVKLAEMDFFAGKQAEADRQVQEVLNENPRSSDGLSLKGRMALAKRNGKEAVQAFRTVLHDQPELATAHYLLGQAYQATGEVNLAKESFERAIALYPGQVDARRALVALESQSGRHRQARARLDDLLKQRPDDQVALDMLMTLDLLTKNWTEAERTLARLQSAAKGSVVAYMAEARLNQAQGRYEKATEAYERAAASAPNDLEPLLSLVKLHVAQGHVDQAKVRLEILVGGQPNHLYGHGLLGEVLTIGGSYAEADRHFQKATTLNPKWITPWLDWGTMWLGQKQYDQAIAIARSGLKVNSESEELHMFLASVHTSKGMINEAILSYESALRLNAKNVLAANNLAVLLVDHKGDPQSLQRAFSLSRDFEKEAPHPLFLDTLGWVRFKMGQQEEAVRVMRDAVAKLPDVPTLNYHLGMAYYQSGKISEAKAHLVKALKSPEPFAGRQEAEQALLQIRG